jgi:hypothetical protein
VWGWRSNLKLKKRWIVILVTRTCAG